MPMKLERNAVNAAASIRTGAIARDMIKLFLWNSYLFRQHTCKRKLLCLVGLIVLSGCMTVPIGTGNIGEMKSSSEIVKIECEPSIKLNYFIGGGFKGIENEVDRSSWLESDRVIYLEKMLSDLNFQMVTPDKTIVRPDYTINYQNIMHDQFGTLGKVFEVITILSLGIVPSYGEGVYYNKITIEDSVGNQVAEYKSIEIPYKRFSGLIFLPFNYGYEGHNMDDKYFRPFASELISKAIKDKVLRCNLNQSESHNLIRLILSFRA